MSQENTYMPSRIAITLWECFAAVREMHCCETAYKWDESGQARVGKPRPAIGLADDMHYRIYMLCELDSITP